MEKPKPSCIISSAIENGAVTLENGWAVSEIVKTQTYHITQQFQS